MLIPTLLLLFFLLTGWLYWPRVKEICGHLSAQTVEVVWYAILGQRAYQLFVSAGVIIPPFASALYTRGHAQNVAGQHLSAAISDLWTSLFGADLPGIAWMLTALTLVGVFGMLTNHTWVRIASNLGAWVWWLCASYLFTVHTPDHSTGGLFIIFWIIQTFCLVSLTVEMDKKYCFQFLNNVTESLAARKAKSQEKPSLIAALCRAVMPNSAR